MPENFPEVWLDRVIQNLDNSDKATFLEGVSELAVDVSQINEGQTSEKNIIYVPTTEFEVDVLINNNTYPIPFQEYDDETIEITLDKYQTKVITVKDDDTIGASYDKIDVVTKSGNRAIVTNKYKKSIHSMAPQADTADTPVMAATGGPDGLTDSTGRLRLTYNDLVAYKDLCDDAGWPAEDRRLVLQTAHWNDLLLDRDRFGSLLVDYKKGSPAPVIAGFELMSYTTMPLYTSAGAKKPFGSIKEAGDTVASVAFVVEGIAKKTGLTKQYYVPAKQNPTRQSNDLSYRHYFVATPFQNKKIGAIR